MQPSRFISCILLLGWLSLSGCKEEAKPRIFGQNYGVMGEKAMVVSAHPEATRVGLEVLERGGNAIDAMVATHFALAVVYPYAGNIGGGGFMVYRNYKGKSLTLDFRETAPGAAHRDMYLDESGNVIEGKSSRTIFSAGVPGSVDGMFTAHAQFGNKGWKSLVQPSIDLAERGFAITQTQADWFNRIAPDLTERNPGNDYLRKETPWQAGDTLKQADLARTLTLIRDSGRAGFYEGTTARLVVKHQQQMNGIISSEDLKNYHSIWRNPVEGDYRGYHVISMPPPSSGGIALLQMLGMVETYDLGGFPYHGAAQAHLMSEAERRAFADRSLHLGDPGYYAVPQKGLLNPGYLRDRFSEVTPDGPATPSKSLAPGQPPGTESTETTHYSIVDAQGNAVAVTTTINSAYGSKIFVDGAGFLLNNEMDDFSAKPGTPNLYGLIGGEANAVAPGKRMLSSMTPTIVEKDGNLFMVTGTPGGSTIITSVFQSLVNVIDYGMTMQEAVNEPRFHHQWLPDQLQYEAGCFSEEVLDQLQERGHEISERDPIGRVDAILRHPDGRLEGAADPRMDDAAAGF